MTERHKAKHEMVLGNHAPIPCTLEEGNMEDLPFELPSTPGRQYKVTILVEELDFQCPHDKEVDMHYTMNCHHCGQELRKKKA